MNIHQDLEAIKEVALHYAKEHDCNYNVILHNPVQGEFGEGSTYEYVTDSYFRKERDCILIMKTDDVLPKAQQDAVITDDFGDTRFVDFKLSNPHLMDWPKQRVRIEPRRVEKTPGRNEPCSCGSGKKYKKCCGR